MVSLVDDEDFEKVRRYKWNYQSIGYGKGYIKEQSRFVWLHRFILDAKDGSIVDHKNGDKLDNRRCNLRFVSSPQSNWNVPKRSTNKSGYRGVHFSKNAQKWSANICLGGKQTFLGYYADIVDAAKAYDEAAKNHRGSFARTNF